MEASGWFGLVGLIITQIVGIVTLYMKNKNDAKSRMDSMLDTIKIQMTEGTDNFNSHVKEEMDRFSTIQTSIKEINEFNSLEKKRKDLKMKIMDKAQDIITLNRLDDNNLIALLLAGRDSTIRLGDMMLQMGVLGVPAKWIENEVASALERLGLQAVHHLNISYIKHLEKHSNIKRFKDLLILELQNISDYKYNGDTNKQFEIALLDFLEKVYLDAIDCYRTLKRHDDK